MYSYVISALKREWGKYYQDYVSFCNGNNIDVAVEVVVLSLRDIAISSYEYVDEYVVKNIKKDWINEILQKDEFLELCISEAKRRLRRHSNKGNFKIAVEATTITLRNVYKDIDYRLGGKRTYAYRELVYLVSSLPVSLENEKVSRKTLKYAGFIDDADIVNLDSFSELTQLQKTIKQKTFLLSQLVSSSQKKEKKKKRKSLSLSSSSAKQLSLLHF